LPRKHSTLLRADQGFLYAALHRLFYLPGIS